VLKETYVKVRIGKHLSDMFPIQNGLKQGDALSPLLSTNPKNYKKGEEDTVGCNILEASWSEIATEPTQTAVQWELEVPGKCDLISHSP
jgi:hypothetical protein